MAETTYTYGWSAFPQGRVDQPRLAQEVADAISSPSLLDIRVDEGVRVVFVFADVLADQSVLDQVVANHTGEPLALQEPALDDYGRSLTVPEPQKEKSALVLVTHNWADPCTWYQQSVKVTDEVLVDSGDGLTFQSAHQNWIDLRHGRQYGEDRLTADGSYLVTVRVDGQEMAEREPFADDGGDYVVDYEAGTVTFAQSQAGKTVTATYWYATSSLFTIKPADGKVLWLLGSEVQFSADVVMNDTVHFQAWAYDPANPPSKIPVTPKTTYKTILDFISEARGCYPVIPAIGGPKRGLATDHITFPFNYLAVKELRASQGLEVRIWLEHHQPMGGTFGNATFYCLSWDE